MLSQKVLKLSFVALFAGITLLSVADEADARRRCRRARRSCCVSYCCTPCCAAPCCAAPCCAAPCDACHGAVVTPPATELVQPPPEGPAGDLPATPEPPAEPAVQ